MSAETINGLNPDAMNSDGPVMDPREEHLAEIALQYASAHERSVDPTVQLRYMNWLRSPELWD
jgi:hypothetical protein